MRTVTPSKISIWEGTPVEGMRYTAQQLAAMKAERPGWARFHDRMVKLTYPSVTAWGPPTEVMVPCPIIAWSKDRKRVLAITPAGDQQWMDAPLKGRP
jgi:hypothetical protein